MTGQSRLTTVVLVLFALAVYTLVERTTLKPMATAAPPALEAPEPARAARDSASSSRRRRRAVFERSAAQVLAIVAMLLVCVIFPTSPLRPGVAIAFLSLCPGIALLTRVRLDLATRLVLGVALSLALNMLVAEALLFSGHWSMELALLIVGVLALVGTGLDLAQLRRREVPAS